MISEFSYVFGLGISRLILAESIVIILYIRSDQYLQRRCCRNFQGLKMIMMIYQFKRIFILIENFRKLGPLQAVLIATSQDVEYTARGLTGKTSQSILGVRSS